MNIKSRIKTLETKFDTVDSNSEFCTCPGETMSTVILPNLDGPPIYEPPQGTYPESCADCSKKIEVITITPTVPDQT